jgi:hypothetical protein
MCLDFGDALSSIGLNKKFALNCYVCFTVSGYLHLRNLEAVTALQAVNIIPMSFI